MPSQRIVYAFEEIPESELHNIPLSALRALRLSGVALSRRGWERMPLSSRFDLASAGSVDELDASRVIFCLGFHVGGRDGGNGFA